MSAAPRRKRTLQSRPASTNIFPVPVDVGIDTIQKSQDRDGNESDTSYCTGDVRTDDSIVEEESRLDADLAQYNQVRRNLTDRDEVEDSDSRDILWASNRAPSPVEPHRETTNERVSSVVDIPTPQPQIESGFNLDRGRNSEIQYRGVNQNLRSHSSNENPRQQVLHQSSKNFPSQSLQGSSSNMNDMRSQGYAAVYDNFYNQPNQYPDDFNMQNFNPNDNGNYGRQGDFLGDFHNYNCNHNQANMRYMGYPNQGYRKFLNSQFGNSHTSNQSNFHQTGGNFRDNQFGIPQGNQGNNVNQGFQRTNNSLNNQKGNLQRTNNSSLPSSSQQAIIEPVIMTPSSVELPISGTQTPQILDQNKVMRYERVPELARTILKEGATQATILQVIANLKSSLFHPYHHTEMVHHMYEWTLLDRFQNLYSKDKIKRKECVNWKTWERENFIAHLEQLVSPTGQVRETFLEAIKAFQLQFDVFDENVELMTFRALRELHEAYPSRTIVEEEQAIKLLMDKLNNPEKINWLARFNKSYEVCDVTKPFTNIMEWRTVLTEMFLTIHSDIKEIQTVIRCNITGSTHTRHVVSKKVGKAENKPPNKPSTRMATCTMCGKSNHDAPNCRSKDSVYANNTSHAYIGSDSHKKLQTDMGAHHQWIPYMPTDGHNPGPHKRKASEPPPTAPAAKKPYAKKVGKDTKGTMLASSASSSSSPQSTTPPNLLPVSFVALSQGGISDEVGVNALLDTGSLAGDFVSRRVVDRHNLKPVISDTIYTVCSGLDNKCYEVNTMLLLRVSFFNELENKNDTFDSKAIILRETPFDFIVGRKTITRYNLFNKIPSQLGNEIFSSVETKNSESVERPCDCYLKGTFNWPPTGSPPAEQTVAPTHRILTSLILNSENLLSGSLPDEDEIDHDKTDTFKPWLPSHSDVDVLSLIHISGDEDLQRRLRSLCRKFKDIISNELPAAPAKIKVLI